MQTRSNATQLVYDDFGQGPVVMFIHDDQTDRHIWTEQIEPVVAAGFRVILTDLHPSGQSTDLINLLDALGIGRAAVCSLTCGSAVLNDLLVHFPHRLAGAYIATSQTCREELDNSLVAALQTDGHRGKVVPVYRNMRMPKVLVGEECHPITHLPQSGSGAAPSRHHEQGSRSGWNARSNRLEFNRQLLDFLTRLAPRRRRLEEEALPAAPCSA